MRITRERKQIITVELGIAEARSIASQIEDIYPRWVGPHELRANTILEQLRERLEYHVAEAEKGNPRV